MGKLFKLEDKRGRKSFLAVKQDRNIAEDGINFYLSLQKSWLHLKQAITCYM